MAISESFKIKCPECAGLVLIKNPRLIGKKVACPKCKSPFVVEDPAVTSGKPAPKQDAVPAGSPPAPAAKAPPPPRDEEDDVLDEVEVVEDEAPAARAKSANGKAEPSKAANGKAATKAPAKSAPADEDEAEAKPRARGKPVARRSRDEDEEAEKPKARGKGKADDADADTEGDEKSRKKKNKKSGAKGNRKLLVGALLAGVGVLVLGIAGFMIVKTWFGRGPAKKNPPVVQSKSNNSGGELTLEELQDKAKTGQLTPEERARLKTLQEAAQSKEPLAKVKGPGGKGLQHRPPTSPQAAALTNLLPRTTQGVFDLNFKNFVQSPLGEAAFDRPPRPFDDDELQQQLGFSIKSLDRLILAENYTNRWAFTVLHSLAPIEDFGPLQEALGLERKSAIKGKPFYQITRNRHWLANLGRLSLGAPAHIGNALPEQKEQPLYFHQHDPQTLVIAHLQPMEQFLGAERKTDTGGDKSRPPESYAALDSDPLKAMLRNMEEQGGEEEQVIFVSATDMSAARVESRNPEYKDRILWRVRPVWDVLNLLDGQTSHKVTLLGTALHVKGNLTYRLANALTCGSEDEAGSLERDLEEKAAPQLVRLFRALLGGHTVEIVRKAEPPAAKKAGEGFPEGVNPGGPKPYPGQPPDMSKMSEEMKRKMMQQAPKGGMPDPKKFQEPDKQEDKTEKPKGSRILVKQPTDTEVRFHLDLILGDKDVKAMNRALGLFMTALRTEIEAAAENDGPARRQKLAAAGRELGEKGLSDHGIGPRQYPPGALPVPDSSPQASQRWTRDPGRRVSWMAGMLPYLGRKDIYDRIDFNASWKDPSNWLTARTLIPEFLDPTYPRRTRYTAYPGMPLDPAATHYVGLAGIGPNAADADEKDAALLRKLGVFGNERGASLEEIKKGRGLSNTILLIRVPHDGPAGVTPWMAGGGSTVRTVPAQNSLQPFLSDDGGQKGTFVAMADGSVRYLKKGMSDAAFQALVAVRDPTPLDFDLEKEAPTEGGLKPSESPAKAKGGGKKDPPVKVEPPPKEIKPLPSLKVPAGWKRITSKDGKISFMMWPNVEGLWDDDILLNLDFPAKGSVEAKRIMASLIGPDRTGNPTLVGTFWVASYSPPDIKKVGKKAVLRKALGEIGRELRKNVKKAAEREALLGGAPAIELYQQRENVQRLGRVAVIDGRVYAAYMSIIDNRINLPDARAFLDSFQVKQ